MDKNRTIVKGLTKALLVGIGAGAVITPELVFPTGGYLYKEFNKEKWITAKRRGILRSTLKRLEQQKLVDWKTPIRQAQGKKEEMHLQLTDTGKQKILRFVIDDLTIQKSKKWDKMWRVVLFDIPEKEKYAREIFRRKLRDMNFYQLRRSVFVHPFECKNEIAFLSHQLKIIRYVQYMLVKEIPGLDIKRFN